MSTIAKIEQDHEIRVAMINEIIKMFVTAGYSMGEAIRLLSDVENAIHFSRVDSGVEAYCVDAGRIPDIRYKNCLLD